MADRDRFYFTRRAAEEEELATAATDPTARAAHRKLQRAYAEKASIGERMVEQPEAIG